MSNTPGESANAVTKRSSLIGVLISGIGWTVAIRWTSKLLGIISLGICARILVPEDYGLVSMAMVAIGLSQVLVQFGLDASLVRNRAATADHYDTAWSLKIIQNTLIAALTFVAAPISAYVVNDMRVMPIIFAVGIAGWIGGLQNIYVVDFLKHLNFRQDFLFAFIPRLISFIVSITSVILLKSYWGLVIGICSAEISRTVVSYFLIKRRPQWSLVKWKEMTGFSFFYFLDGLAQYSVYHLDRLIVGYAGGASKVGVYGVAREVSGLPSTELVLPIGRAFMPTLATLNDEPERQTAAIEKALGGVMLVAVPVAIGFVLIAPEFISLLFGPKWTKAIPLVTILSFAAITSGFRAIAQNVLIVVGLIRVNAALSWAYAVVVLVLIYPSYLWLDMDGVCWLYSSAGIAMKFIYGVILHRHKLLHGSMIWINISRTYVAAGLMYAGIIGVEGYLPDADILRLIVKILMGAGVYIVSISSLWWLMGKPKSSEKIILDLVVDRLKKFF